MRELYTYRRSSVHQLDARVKLVFALAFVICLSLTPYRAWPAYVLFLAVSLSAALLSHLGIPFVLKRALLAAPFFLAAAPLVFTGPPPHVPVALLPGLQMAYSPEGAGRVASIAIRSWIAVQAAIILAATTRFSDLLLAMQQLKVPKLFVAIIGLMWRYLFVISDEVVCMLRARASRSATAPGTHRAGGTLYWRAQVAGGMAGSLFIRSLERADRVHAAMLSRGYTGSLPPSEAVPLDAGGWRALFLGLCLLALLWLLGLLTGG